MDVERTKALLQFMEDEGLVPSLELEMKRKDAIEQLKQIVLSWIKKVAWQRRLPKSQIAQTSATILTYGSYGLGAHGPNSDIDALCVVPCFATMAEDYFVVLRNMLQSRPEVSEIHCVKDAKVPLMRFKFNGIAIDLPYARLKVLSVADNVDILKPSLLRAIDETSQKSLSGVCANMRILKVVPNMKKFQTVLRCLKLWARRRGVYGNLVGFLGGIHITVLTAYVCHRNPSASISALISIFFNTFAFWPWPNPVMLEGRLPKVSGEVTERRSLMPIQLPSSPHEFCHSNITRSTFNKMRAEFLRGHALTRDYLQPDFQWNTLFEPFQYAKIYKRFIRIFLAAADQGELGDWVGWVKSCFRVLLLTLEEIQGLCDPNPSEFIDPDVSEPNVVFYWGLRPGRCDFSFLEPVEFFLKHATNGYQGPLGKLELSTVESSQFPKNANIDSRSIESSKGYWRIYDYSQPRKAVYSHHVPNYLVGYTSTNAAMEYPEGSEIIAAKSG